MTTIVKRKTKNPASLKICGIKRKNKKNKKKTKIRGGRKTKKFLFFVLLVGFLGAVVWTVFFSQKMRIRSVTISGTNKNVNQQRAEEVVNEGLKGKYGGLIYRDNFLLAPRREIEEKLKREFVFVKKIEINKGFPSKLSIKIFSHKGQVVWCGNNNCGLINENGEAFYVSQNREDAIFDSFVLINDESMEIIEKNQFVPSAGKLKFYKEALDKFKNKFKQDQIKKVVTPSAVSGEMEIETEKGWRVYFSFDYQITDQVAILEKFISEQGSTNNLEYVDLRSRGKVVYKMKNSQEEQEKEKQEDDLQE